MNAVTIKDIARALNLSTSTVSRALRNSYEINSETKRLVTEYAERVNYRPNPIALSLKENRSRFIGVVVPQLTNNFFSQVINGIEAVAYDRGYHLIILQTHESYDREVVMVEQAVARRTDGLLISLSNATSDLGHIRQLQEYSMPIVLFDRVSEQLNLPCITADNFGGAFAATEHLVQTGRRRIAHLAIPAHLSVSQERLAGYRAALEKYGLPYDETLVRHVDFFYNDVDALLTQLLTLSPDALFVSSDRLAIECLAGLKKRGIAIPEELSLLGFTNTPLADLLAPPMSVVEQPAFEMGQTATRHLIDLIEGKSREPMPSRVTMPTRMVVRASSERDGG